MYIRAGYAATVFGGQMLVLGGGDGQQGLHGVFALKLAGLSYMFAFEGLSYMLAGLSYV
jgi:hypothetical protein